MIKNKSILFASISFVFLCFLLFPRRAYAYMDMGTGSYVIQVLIASFVGVALAVKIYWRKITGAISSFLLRKKAPQNDERSDS
jgi:hypothetical protein